MSIIRQLLYTVGVFFISQFYVALFLVNVIIHSIVYTIVCLPCFFIISFLSPLHPLYPSSAPYSLSIDSIEFASFRLDIVSRRAEIIIQHIEHKQKAWKMNEWLVTIANSNIWQHTIQCGLALFRINYIIFWKIVSHSEILWWLPGVSIVVVWLIFIIYM